MMKEKLMMPADSSDLISKLQATLGKMEIALGAIVEAIAWTDHKGLIQWSNAIFDRLVGRHRLAVLGSPLSELLPLIHQGKLLPASAHPVNLVLETQVNTSGVYEFQQGDKRLVLGISCACIRLGEDLSAVIAIHDITLRQQEEEELRQHRAHLQRLIEERTTTLIATNEELHQEIIERRRIEKTLRESEAQNRALAEAATQQAQQLSQTLQQLQQTQSQLIQTEKMSSLGQLVAGISHEINNPVNFIYGNISHISNSISDLMELLKLYEQYCANPTPEISTYAETIDLEFLVADLPHMLNSMRLGADRIRQIVLSLRNFSRLDEASMKLVNIHEGIDSTLLILNHRLNSQLIAQPISIIKEYGTLPDVECYPSQLNQVFLHILTNAIDALERYSKQQSALAIASYLPQIVIRTSQQQDFCVIQITDNGAGIDEVERQRIFDPFFTTKPVGQGIGLGLSVSYSIVVDKHGGSLKCVSIPNQGTEFWIEIPLLQRHRVSSLPPKF